VLALDVITGGTGSCLRLGKRGRRHGGPDGPGIAPGSGIFCPRPGRTGCNPPQTPDAYPDGSEARPGDDTTLDVASARLIQEWYLSCSDHDGSDFWNAPFGATRSHEQIRSFEDLVAFWRKALRLLQPQL